jgi:hypothetical protein
MAVFFWLGLLVFQAVDERQGIEAAAGNGVENRNE